MASISMCRTKDTGVKLTILVTAGELRNLLDIIGTIAADPPVDPPAVPSENPRASKPDQR